MTRTLIAPAALLLGLGMLGGCASENGLSGTSNLTTSAVTPVAAPKVDPACVTLSAQIEQLRKEGTIDRLQQASQGKGESVQIKRTAIAKQAELNKANADYQAKCSTITPKPSSAAAPAPVAKEAAAAAGAATTAAAAPAKTAAVAAPAAQAVKKVVKKAAAPVEAVKAAAAPVQAVKAAAPVVVPTAAAAAPAVVPTAIAPTQSRVPDVVVTTVPTPKE